MKKVFNLHNSDERGLFGWDKFILLFSFKLQMLLNDSKKTMEALQFDLYVCKLCTFISRWAELILMWFSS